MELLDEVQVRAINVANGKSLPEVPTLMFEFIGTGYCYIFFYRLNLCMTTNFVGLPYIFTLVHNAVVANQPSIF